MTKYCKDCSTDKPVSEFGVSRRAKDGRSTYCIACKRLRDAAYRAANLDRVRARQAAHMARYRTGNADKVRASNAAWYAANAEREREAKRRRYYINAPEPRTWRATPFGFKIPPTDREAYVYRLYDADNVLLYVGKTMDLSARFDAHRAEKPWFPDVVTITYETYVDDSLAYPAEAYAIATENPVYNKMRPAPWDPSEVPAPSIPARIWNG